MTYERKKKRKEKKFKRNVMPLQVVIFVDDKSGKINIFIKQETKEVNNSIWK